MSAAKAYRIIAVGFLVLCYDATMSDNVRFEIDAMLEAYGLEPTPDGLQRLAVILSESVSKEPPWGHRYITSLRNGTIEPSKLLRKALSAVGAVLDGTVIASDAVEVSVYSSNPENIAGAYIMGSSKICPRCDGKFVGSVPWRVYCPVCSPPR